MTEIEEEYRQKQKNGEEIRLVLVHPTPFTSQLSKVSETNATFRTLCTAILSGIDVLEMFDHALRARMGGEGEGEYGRSLAAAVTRKFAESDTYRQLVKLAARVVETGETFSWIPLDRGGEDKRMRVPAVPGDQYLVVYVDPLDEWICRDTKNNRPLDLVFVQDPLPNLRPRSTVAYMLERCQFMERVTEDFLRASSFACTPYYLATDRHFEGDNDPQRNRTEQNNPLDPKLVNQSRVNEQLEHMIAANLQASSFANNTQRTTATHGKLTSYVSELGARYVSDARENRQLQRDVRDLTDRLQQLEESKAEPMPKRWTVPSDMEVSGSQLGVNPVDLLSHLRRHDSEWMAACLGYVGPSSVGRSNNNNNNASSAPIDRELEVFFLKRKQRQYALLLLFAVLNDWMEASDIHLAIPLHFFSVQDGNLNLQ